MTPPLLHRGVAGRHRMVVARLLEVLVEPAKEGALPE